MEQEQDKNEVIQKKQGAQPGNTNALKHGLYIQHARVKNTTPIEKASLYDLSAHIGYLKDYMRHLYEVGITSKDLHEINETMRSLALAALGLGRLVHVHEQNSAIPIPDDMWGKKIPGSGDENSKALDLTFKELEAKLDRLDRIFGPEKLDEC